MSVAQVKKRFAEMTEYLNRDKEGQRRLKLLKDDVNVLRTSLAAAEEATQLAVTVKDAARERADAAEARVAELEAEMQSLRQKVENLTRESNQALDLLTRPEEEEDDADKVPLDASEAAMKLVIKALRRRSRYCPPMFRMAKHMVTDTPFYDRDDLAAGWTHDAIWTLGAAVAVLSVMHGQVVIFSNHRLIDIVKSGPDSGTGRNIMGWFAMNNIDPKDMDSLRLNSPWAVNGLKSYQFLQRDR